MAPLQWLFFEGLRYSSAPTITSIDNVQQRVKHHFAEWGDNRTLCPLKQGLKHSGHALLSDPPELRGHPVPHSALILFKFLREPRSKNYCNHNRTHAPAVITCLLCRTLACFVKVPRGLSARNLFESAVEVHISKVSTAADTADPMRSARAPPVQGLTRTSRAFSFTKALGMLSLCWREYLAKL